MATGLSEARTTRAAQTLPLSQPGFQRGLLYPAAFPRARKGASCARSRFDLNSRRMTIREASQRMLGKRVPHLRVRVILVYSQPCQKILMTSETSSDRCIASDGLVSQTKPWSSIERATTNLRRGNEGGTQSTTDLQRPLQDLKAVHSNFTFELGRQGAHRSRI